MRVRGFNHFSPLPVPQSEAIWPSAFIDAPGRQFALLAEKYTDKEQGRIPLPASEGELLVSHALSLTCRELILTETGSDTPECFASMATVLIQLLRQSPTKKGWAEMLAILGATHLHNTELIVFVQKEAGRQGQATVLNELLLWT